MIKSVCIVSLSLFLLAPSVFAGPSTSAEMIASVRKNTEIRNLIAVIAKSRKLKCGLDSETAQITPSTDPANESDTFQVGFFCNDVNQGANVHQLMVSGYVSKDAKGVVATVLTNLAVNASE